MKIRTKHTHHAPRGQVLILMALAMVGLLAFTGLAIDGGRFYAMRRQAQNATDMAALAAIPIAANTKTVPLNTQVWTEIKRVAGMNGIDTSTPANLKAWYLTDNGAYLTGSESTSVVPDNTSAVPSDVIAIRVWAAIPFHTFFGNFFGRPNMTAEATSAAGIKFTVEHENGYNYAVFSTGGNTCNDIANGLIAHNYDDTNSAKFLTPVLVDGSLRVNKVNASDFYGNFVVTGQVSPNQTTPPDGPFNNSNKWHNSSVFNKNSSYQMPPLVNLRDPEDPSKRMDASSFVPAHGAVVNGYAAATNGGNHPGSWIRFLQRYQTRLGIGSIDSFVTYVAGTGDADLTGANFKTAYLAGRRGIFYIDGDVNLPNGSYPDASVIVNGVVQGTNNNMDYYTAGKGSGGVTNNDRRVAALNISILAGGDLGGNYRCAGNPDDWVLRVGSEDGKALNNYQFHGLVYVPYGQINFLGNTSGGSNGAQFSEAIIAYSVFLSGNNWQFYFDPTALDRVYPGTQLEN